MKGNSQRRNSKRTGAIGLPSEPEMALDMRRKLLADFCKLVAARQNVAARSTKVEADLSSGDRPQFDPAAVRPKRPAALPYLGTVAASFSEGDDDAGAAADQRHPEAPAPPTSNPPDMDVRALSPRLLQTLDGLLNGDNEKQIALKLSISKHTVHAYVKMLYRRYGASSRGELLARWVQRGQRTSLGRLP